MRQVNVQLIVFRLLMFPYMAETQGFGLQINSRCNPLQREWVSG